MCFAFLMLLLLVERCFYFKSTDDFLSQFDNVLSVQLTYSQNKFSDFEGVFNGNNIIINVKNLDKLDIKELEGITIKLNLVDFKFNKFIDKNNILIDKKYDVSDNIVYDCHFASGLVNGWKNVQVVIGENVVMLGIPSVNCF